LQSCCDDFAGVAFETDFVAFETRNRGGQKSAKNWQKSATAKKQIFHRKKEIAK
jgi:hypothetical protein